MSSIRRAPARSPASVVPAQAPSRPAASPFVVRSSDHPAPARKPEGAGGEKRSQAPATLGPTTDGHERAKRRARVILSDLTLYHREALLRAARATDAQLELGTLWRDAVISYNEVAPPELRSVTNYLEEELDKYLVQLRSG
jgi:hypothetical protein